MLELSNTLAGVFGFTSKAIVAALGTSSRNSSKRFGPNAPAKKVTPVMLPSGRLRLLTSPRTTGSLPTAKTMGIVCVAAFAASAVGLPLSVAITVTCRWIRSATKASRRSQRYSAQRYSMATFCLSTNPSSPSPRRKAAATHSESFADLPLRTPITGIACCARAASGHAAAAPAMSDMNSRRFTADYLPYLDRNDSTHGRKSAALRDFDFGAAFTTPRGHRLERFPIAPGQGSHLPLAGYPRRRRAYL